MRQSVLKIGKNKINVEILFGIKKYIGLMGWKEGNVILPCGNIHTFFCKKIKVIEVKNWKVKKIINTKPWNFYNINNCDFIIETTKNIKVKIGDNVRIYKKTKGRIRKNYKKRK